MPENLRELLGLEPERGFNTGVIERVNVVVP
jgi:hypothetical protein